MARFRDQVAQSSCIKAWLTVLAVLILYATVGYFALHAYVPDEVIMKGWGIKEGGSMDRTHLILSLFIWPIMMAAHWFSQPVSW